MVVDTAQKNMKEIIDAYYTAANVKEDNGSTNATVICAFDWPNYPLSRVFIDKGVDAVISVGQASSQALVDVDLVPYGYVEKVPVTMASMDKTGITAMKLLRQLEAEVRRVFEAQPGAWAVSVRKLSGSTPKTQRLGAFYLYSEEYDIEYKRDLL